MRAATSEPIASDDVARAVSDAALAEPVKGIVEVAGPDKIGLDNLVRRFTELVTKDLINFPGKEVTMITVDARWRRPVHRHNASAFVYVLEGPVVMAFSAILRTTVGGLTTFLTTFLNQRFAMRRDILAKDVANREQLYSKFLKEVGNLYFDSVNRTLGQTCRTVP